jgi:hypothetical protein
MVKTIKLVTFINKFRKELTKRIIALHPDTAKLKSFNDKERRVMVLNEPTLASWATSKGVVVASALKS